LLVTQPPSFVSQSAITSVYVCLWTHMDGRSGHARGQLNELCSCKNIGADAVTQLYQLGDRWGKGGGRSHKLHPMFLESHACLSSAVNKHHGGEGGRKRGSQEGAATASLTPPRLSPAKWEKEEQLEGGSRVWEEIPQETIHHLIRSMPRRCREVIRARGGHTHYWASFWLVLRTLHQGWISL
jgi:hypothetical protein